MTFIFSFSPIKCNEIGQSHTNQERSFRGSHLQMFFKTDVFENFAIFTGKHLCWSLFIIKLQASRVVNLPKRNPNTGVFL